MDNKKFGHRIRELRLTAGMTLSPLAEALGVSIAFLSGIERGEKNPPDEAGIKKILAKLGKLDLFPELTQLARVSRRSILFSLDKTSTSTQEMLLSLARSCESGDIESDVELQAAAQQFLEALRKKRKAEGELP
jgi:transcriptional regulator with XRE-family HTH domain